MVALSVSLLRDLKSYLQDSLVQLVTDPPLTACDRGKTGVCLPAGQTWSQTARILARSIFCPWTKRGQQPPLTRTLFGCLVGLAGLATVVLLREKVLKKTEKSLHGKIVLITGGASGIGKLMAERFVFVENCRVIVWDVNQDLLDATVAEISERCGGGDGQGKIWGMRVDVTDRAQVHKFVRVAEQLAGGPVDILVNNAGIVHGRNVLECDEDMMQRTVQVNLVSHFWTVRAVLPSMVQRNSGHIVCVASATALCGIPGMADYSASKGGAFGFTEALRLELKHTSPGVRTTIVCPYFINTGMFDGVTTKFDRLLPILNPEYTADKIVQGVKRDEELIVLPRFTYSVYAFRLFCPVWLQDNIADFFGITHSMKSFKGLKPEERETNIVRVSKSQALMHSHNDENVQEHTDDN